MVVVARLALVVVAFLLAVPTGSADWLQGGHDAARQGLADAAGPEWPDMGWALDLQESLQATSAYALRYANGTLYFLGEQPGCWLALFATNATTPVPRRLACVAESAPDTLVHGNLRKNDLIIADGRLVVVSGSRPARFGLMLPADDFAAAYAMDGTFDWRLPLAPDDATEATFCTAWAARPHELLATCVVGADDGNNNLVIVGRSIADGSLQWTVPLSPLLAHSEPQVDPVSDPSGYALAVANGAQDKTAASPSLIYTPWGISLVDDLAVVTIRHYNYANVADGTSYEGGALLALRLAGPAGPSMAWSFYGPGVSATSGSMPVHSVVPATGGNGLVYFSAPLRESAEMNIIRNDGEYLSYSDADLGGERPTQNVLAQDVVVMAATTRLAAYYRDPLPGTYAMLRAWITDLPAGYSWSLEPFSMVAAGDTLYGVAVTESGEAVLHAFELASGRLRWSIPGGREPIIADGRLFVANQTTVLAIGLFEGGIVAKGTAETRYPAPGEILAVDFAASRPGTGGPAQAIWADWGDGFVGGWEEGAHASHVYDEVGTFTARFQVRNAEGQTSTQLMTFYVGAEDPGETFLEGAFSEENQETSFFFLGLVATALAGLFGILKVARRRSRLRTEMRALEKEFEGTKDHPAECEIALSERRARAHKLALEAKLDEGQASILVQRVVDLRHKLRMGQMDRRLNFLPYGVVQALQEHLRDGTLSLWERDHLVKVLDEDKILSSKQKTEVRSIIDGWFEKDAGAKA